MEVKTKPGPVEAKSHRARGDGQSAAQDDHTAQRGVRPFQGRGDTSASHRAQRAGTPGRAEDRAGPPGPELVCRGSPRLPRHRGCRRRAARLRVPVKKSPRTTPCARALAVFAAHGGLPKAPCAQTVSHWVTRLSLVRMQALSAVINTPLMPPFAKGHVWMIDLSIGLGSGRVLQRADPPAAAPWHPRCGASPTGCAVRRGGSRGRVERGLDSGLSGAGDRQDRRTQCHR